MNGLLSPSPEPWSQGLSRTPRKRRHISLSEQPSSPRRSLSRQAPSPPESSAANGRQQQQQQEQHQPETSDGHKKQQQSTESILAWVRDVVKYEPMTDPSGSVRSRMRGPRGRSISPTKKSSEYRQTGLALSGINIDHDVDQPADVVALCRRVLGKPEGTLTNSNGEVENIVEHYRKACQQLTMESKGEGEWRSKLHERVIEPLVDLLAQKDLKTNASDKPWRPDIKPCAPLLQLAKLPWMSLAANPSPTSISPAEPNSPADASEASEPATSISGTTGVTIIDANIQLSTPKPDIVVGLARPNLTSNHQAMLVYWQENQKLLSEPHLAQIGLHFPFLLVEAKGLATGGNMMGAENQAAVGGACAINMLKQLQGLDASSSLCHIVFSVTTEGPIHQLCVHYIVNSKYYMDVLKIWRATLGPDCLEFVLAMAHIIQWGGNEYRRAIIASLERLEKS